jgi:DNA ligase-1
MIKLRTLYKIDSVGKLREWSVHVDANTFYAIKGLVGMKLAQDKPTQCTAKNVGRSNETTPEEQAEIEAKAKWEKKIRAGYAESKEGAKVKKFYNPMLAQSYKDRKDEISFPLYSQPKLDGIRCIVRLEDEVVVGRTRNGKVIDAIPHILKGLEGFFKAYPNTILDGELYNHDLRDNFNKITSLVRKQTPVWGKNDTDKSFAKKEKAFSERLEEGAEFLQYWVYDAPQVNILKENANFSIRYAEILSKLPKQKCLIVVPTAEIYSEGTLNAVYGSYLEDGYEGQMVRVDGAYENKRSKSLLKRKEFIDAEYKVLDISEGNGNRSGTAKHLVLQCDTTGRSFNSNIKGTFEYLASVLTDREEHIGKMATIRFFELTPDGIPRFPYAVGFRDYE